MLPIGTSLPGGILATRVFVSGPDKLILDNLACSDFDMIQLNYIFRIRGLPSSFPQSKSGDYGYDLWLATGQWFEEKWKGPLVAIPATSPSDDPEASRKTT